MLLSTLSLLLVLLLLVVLLVVVGGIARRCSERTRNAATGNLHESGLWRTSPRARGAAAAAPSTRIPSNA